MMVPPFLESLPRPGAKVRAVLDTDTYNEIDDQYALAYASLSENIDLEAVYAAPFMNERSTSPADGVEKSFEEAARVLGRLGSRGDSVRRSLFRGSRSFMTSPKAPVRSEAAEDLVARAMEGQPPLHVKSGDGFVVPAGVKHDARNTGTQPLKLVVTYYVEKGKPLATPAP